jgi:malonyl-CoA/methylmalonyl-CoA synthetase
LSDNLFDLFRSRFPDDLRRPFIEMSDGTALGYDDLLERSGRMARLLTDSGVEPGDRVAVQVDKSPDALFLYLACLRAGAIYLPLNTAYQPDEIAYFLSDAEPRAVVCRPDREALFRERAAGAAVFTLDGDGKGSLTAEARSRSDEFATVPRAADDIAAILYSSGTTGRPKGAMLSHRNLASNALVLHKVWGFRPDDVLLHALPIFHAHGLFVATHCVLLNGGSMIFLPKFDADEVLHLLPRATVMMGVPTFYTRLLAMPGFTAEVCRTMRMFIAGSAPLLPETFNEFKARTGHAVRERYGTTETVMLTSNPLDGERIAGSVGPALPGVTVRIRGEDGSLLPQGGIGQIEVKGDNVFKGYWRMPEKTRAEFTEDGFFRTGDMGRIDERDYVHIVGRAKDLIISGGYNVYPKEVEDCIDGLAGVAESTVVGVPHPDFGEVGLAIVVPKPGHDGLTQEDVLQALRERLANYKIPKRVLFVPDLPRNTMGKVQKNLLREQYADA